MPGIDTPLDFQQVLTPTWTPATGRDQLYFKSDDLLYRRTAAGVETLVGGGATGNPFGNLPVGAIVPFAGTTAPYGFLMCDGTTKPQSSYPDLFAVISTTYNTGGELGSEFRLPDLKGRSPLGVGTAAGVNGATAHTLAQRGGEETHVLTAAELTPHVHYHDATGQAAFINSPAAPQGAASGTAWGFKYPNNQVTTESTGSGGAHNNLSPYLGLNWIIRALSSGTTELVAAGFRGTAAQTIPSFTNVVVGFQATPDHNAGGIFTNDTANNIVTVARAGVYQVTCEVTAGVAQVGRIILRLEGWTPAEGNPAVGTATILLNSEEYTESGYAAPVIAGQMALQAGHKLRVLYMATGAGTGSIGAAITPNRLNIALVPSAAGGVSDTGWTNLTLQNGWVVNSGRTPGVRKVGGICYLRGSMNGGANGSQPFLLPPGFRPGQWASFPAMGNGPVAGALNTDINGTTQGWLSGGGTILAIDGITFPADN